jgi:hypothetical protein
MPTTETTPFATLELLRAEHGRLLRASKDPSRESFPTGSNTIASEIVQYLARVQATGTRLDFVTDRESAQSVLDYWTATLFTLPEGRSAAQALPSLIPGVTAEAVNLQLAAFDSQTLTRATAAADTWLRLQRKEDRDLADAILLRLTRLQAEGQQFALVSTVRAALHDLDIPENVDTVLDGLTTAGVIRIAKAEDPSIDRIALRSLELLDTWPALKSILKVRLQLRHEATNWAASQKPITMLATADRLEQIRQYHDHNGVERAFAHAGMERQARILEQAASDR